MDMTTQFIKLLSNSETSGAFVKTLVNEYKPLVYAIGNEILGVMKDFSNNKEYAECISTGRKNLFDAYVSAGFTEEQAMALLLNDNLKLMNNIKSISTNIKKVK